MHTHRLCRRDKSGPSAGCPLGGKEVTHISGFPFGIESRDPDIPSCWHSGTMRRSCCWSIPCHNQADPLPTNDAPASDIPQRFQCPAMLGDGGVGMGQKEMATTAAGKNLSLLKNEFRAIQWDRLAALPKLMQVDARSDDADRR